MKTLRMLLVYLATLAISGNCYTSDKTWESTTLTVEHDCCPAIGQLQLLTLDTLGVYKTKIVVKLSSGTNFGNIENALSIDTDTINITYLVEVTGADAVDTNIDTFNIGDLEAGDYTLSIMIYASIFVDTVIAYTSFTLGDQVSISADEKDHQFLIFPNPAQSIVQIQTEEIGEMKSLRLLDNYGRIIKQIKGLTSDINLNDILPGIYVVQIFTNDAIYSNKLIIE
jgi:hypothetical protein